MERIHNQRGWISLLSISAIAFTLVGAYFVFDGNLGFIERLYDQASYVCFSYQGREKFMA